MIVEPTRKEVWQGILFWLVVFVGGGTLLAWLTEGM